MILIIGAGLAGLSAAYHLRDDDCVIVEKESEVGGLCRSKTIDGFTFDYTGHLLHINDPYFASFITENFPGTFAKHERRSSIYSKGVYTPYPFQINTFGLPRETIYECLYGFVKARMEEEGGEKGEGKSDEKSGAALTRGMMKKISRLANEKDEQSVGSIQDKEDKADLSFRKWILKKFGEGFAKHFFFPFNEKMYCRDLEELSSEWTSWSIPVLSLQEVLAGAIGIPKTRVGYNKTFLYPVSGGIEVLPDRMALKCRNLLLDSEIDSIDLLKKEALVRNGGFIRYDALISTIPLNRLLAICKNIPEEIAGLESRLKYVKVIDVNIGFEGGLQNDFHWIYFPDPGLPFYRVGFPSNFSGGVAPAGCSSLYAEVSLRGEEDVTEAELDRITDRVLEALLKLRILEDENRIVVKDVNVLEPAYVLFDSFRKNNLPRIISSLGKAGVITVGRFGGWDYLPMEGAFLAGQRAARLLTFSR